MNRQSLVAIATISAVLVLGSGCAFNRVAAPGVALHNLQVEALKRTEYSILGPATGKGCATYVGLWPLPLYWTQSDDSNGMPYTIDVSGLAKGAAISNATQSVPNADAMIAPRFQEEGTAFGIWYKKVCTTVLGKAIEIKTDQK